MARSPNYPAISLGEAISTVQKIYDREHQATMTHEVAATAMGYGALHGPARRKIGALRKYGLIDAVGTSVRLSESAMAILHPKDESERVAAIRAAAVRPELYRELAAQPGASDANLISTLIRRGFMPDGARQAVAAFRQTMSLVEPEANGYAGAEGEEPEVLDQPPPHQEKLGPRAGTSMGAIMTPETTTAEFTWLLPKGVRVDLRFAGGPFTKDGLKILRRYLDVV